MLWILLIWWMHGMCCHGQYPLLPEYSLGRSGVVHDSVYYVAVIDVGFVVSCVVCASRLMLLLHPESRGKGCNDSMWAYMLRATAFRIYILGCLLFVCSVLFMLCCCF